MSTAPGHEPTHRLVPRHRRRRDDPAFEFPPPPVVEPRPDRSIDARFAEFHAAHPEVYAALVRLAREGKAAGHTKLGIGMLFEVLRWEHMVRPDDSEPYRLNNVYRSRYARLVMDQEPDLAGIFDTRELISRRVR